MFLRDDYSALSGAMICWASQTDFPVTSLFDVGLRDKDPTKKSGAATNYAQNDVLARREANLLLTLTCKLSFH